MSSLGARSHVTLGLCTLLHGFTHALGTLLVPLYLLMAADLNLSGVRRAALIVTIYGLVYNAMSYAGGMLSDRFDRRWLLGIGLAGNSLAIVAMGLTRQYEMLIMLAILAGMFGTLFHPCANALVPAHYPKSTGLAIGILGMGSGLGFFAGPQFAGWRATSAGWHWGAIAEWQRPCIEIGIAGLIVAILFVMLAREARPRATFHHAPDPDEDDDAMLPARISVEAIVTQYRGKEQAHGGAIDAATRRRVIAIAAVLGCRDFAGVASLTAVSLYLQKAHSYDARHAGFIVGTMMLFSILINPLAVYISPGSRRLPALAMCLVAGGIVFALTPAVPVRWAIVVLSLFQMCQLGSYAISDAAMLERVDPAVRGRVVGLFLTLAGTFAALSPWVIGSWVDLLGERSHHAGGFVAVFATLGAMMIIAAFSTPIIARLGEPIRAAQPLAPPPGTPGERRGEGQLIAAK
jgi:MFS family permease